MFIKNLIKKYIYKNNILYKNLSFFFLFFDNI